MGSETNTALTKLAEELTNRVDALEKENKALRGKLSKAASLLEQQLQRKTAAETTRGAVVSDKVADDTIRALYKAGALEASQLEESRRVLLADAEAPHRILCRLLDGQTQMKTASTDVDNVSGGRLANNDIKPDAQGDCLDRMMSTLRML